MGALEGVVMDTMSRQAWYVLRLRAANRQTITYGELARLVGGTAESISSAVLYAIGRYCSARNLPDLSSIVVRRDTSMPGYSSDAKLHDERLREVFAYDWSAVKLSIPPKS